MSDLPDYGAQAADVMKIANGYADRRGLVPAELQAQALMTIAAGLFAIADAIQTAGRKPDG